MTADADREQASRIIQAVEEALEPATAYRDPSPLPAVGPTPPVAQPGRPPMSQRATDASMVMLAAGAASLPIGGATSLVLYTLGSVDPITLAIGAAAPVAVILAIGALIRAAGRSMEGVGAEHHHHYEGPVHQEHRNINTKTSGFIAKTTNNGS
ncbi:hypothetical protein ACIPY6_28645 [Streptomyces sp. NPDC090054]|uniref:hypothetical protein n=1 Tax=Streptomyces sp. NPDC090054 TaxID=3365933 RepID=UPI0037FCE384